MTFLGFEKMELYDMIPLRYFTLYDRTAKELANTLKIDYDIFPKDICMSL